jgi:nucleotidyltransferase substrate binding protein (TIGR01987 family)
MYSKVRWGQRLQNFERALKLLEEALARPSCELSDLEKEGLIQRFEYTYELAWKCLKDYLVHTGVTLPAVTPLHTVREAFAARLIPDGDVWIDMIEKRNLTSHVYHEEVAVEVVTAIEEFYGKVLRETFDVLQKRLEHG